MVVDEVTHLNEASTRVLSAAFFASPYAAFIVDTDGDILHCNRRAARMFAARRIGAAQVQPQDVQGMAFHELTYLSRDEILDRLRNGVIEGLFSLRMQYHTGLSARSGTKFRVSLLRAFIPGKHLYLVTQDQLKSAAEAIENMNARRIQVREDLDSLEKSHDELQRLFVTMETFTNAASHDLRTPLNTISGLLSMFARKYASELPTDAREYLDHMDTAVQQMERLITDLLDHARSTSVQMKAHPIPVLATLREIGSEVLFDNSNVEASINISGDEFDIVAEPALFRILIVNLLSNALKYRHPERNPEIKLRCVQKTPSNGAIEVSDNGRGLDVNDVIKIFRPFKQLKPSASGVGLGLATCKEICDRHGWEISADASTDAGAVFKISLPVM